MLRFREVNRPSGVKDKNDCTVRAFSNAKGVEYHVAHSRMAAAGRVNNRGMALRECVRVYDEEGGEAVYINEDNHMLYKQLEMRGSSVAGVGPKMTFSKFIEKFPKGRYLVLITGHATTVIDGEIVDSFIPKARCRVYIAFQFPEPKVKIVRKYSPVSLKQEQLNLFGE